MDTRKILLVATIAVIALVAVGIGYAYSATTVTNSNTITQTNIEVLPYSIENPTVGTTDPDYTGSAQNVTYNTYNDAGTVTYNIDGIHALSEIKKIAIKWTDPGVTTEVVLSAFTMKVSNASIDTYMTENSDCITVSLSDGNKTWAGTYNTTTDQWDFNVTSTGAQSADLKASKTGTLYTLTFATDDEGNTPTGNPLAFEHANVLDNTEFTITFTGTVTP